MYTTRVRQRICFNEIVKHQGLTFSGPDKSSLLTKDRINWGQLIRNIVFVEGQDCMKNE